MTSCEDDITMMTVIPLSILAVHQTLDVLPTLVFSGPSSATFNQHKTNNNFTKRHFALEEEFQCYKVIMKAKLAGCDITRKQSLQNFMKIAKDFDLNHYESKANWLQYYKKTVLAKFHENC